MNKIPIKTQLNSYWNISRNIDFIDENFGKWRFKDKSTLTCFAFEIMPNLFTQDMKLLDFVFLGCKWHVNGMS